jgi:cobalt-zinc-cadmium efflux system membrane fusion protein
VVAILFMATLLIPLFTTQQADAAETKMPALPKVTAAKTAERDLAQRFADGSIFVPKPTQRVLALRTLFTEDSSHPRTIELPGRVIHDPSGMGIVQSSLSGRLLPPKGGFPRLGAKVAKGDLLATVVPVQSVTDVTSQDQKRREIEQEIALVEKRLKRWLAVANSVPRKDIEEAELKLAGLNSRLEGLVSSTATPEQLVAPVDGVISSVRAIAGQVAEPNAVIFEIVHPSRYWVEALSYEAHAFGETAHGSFSKDTRVALAYRGTGLAERAQAVTMLFEITEKVESVRAGQFLTVLAPTAETSRGIAIPRTSIIRASNGQSIVYEHTNAERFVPREVRVAPLDGDRVLIVSGIEPGKRIVTQGAELLNQIR